MVARACRLWRTWPSSALFSDAPRLPGLSIPIPFGDFGSNAQRKPERCAGHRLSRRVGGPGAMQSHRYRSDRMKRMPRCRSAHCEPCAGSRGARPDSRSAPVVHPRRRRSERKARLGCCRVATEIGVRSMRLPASASPFPARPGPARRLGHSLAQAGRTRSLRPSPAIGAQPKPPYRLPRAGSSRLPQTQKDCAGTGRGGV
jgi:hypothetical protein